MNLGNFYPPREKKNEITSDVAFGRQEATPEIKDFWAAPRTGQTPHWHVFNEHLFLSLLEAPQS